MKKTLTLAAVAVALVATASAQENYSWGPDRPGTPFVAVTAPAGSVFEPVGPALFDSTAVTGEPRDNPFPHQMAAAGAWMFAATGQGVYIVDVSRPDSPRKVNYLDGSSFVSAGATWPVSDLDFLMNWLDVLADDDGVIAAGAREAGFWIFDTRNKSAKKFHYQDTSRLTFHVRMYRRGGTKLAAAATGYGIVTYNVDRAQAGSSCVENSASETKCPGVFLDLLPRPAGTSGAPAIDVSPAGEIAAIYQSRLYVYPLASGLRYGAPFIMTLPMSSLAVAYFDGRIAVLGRETIGGIAHSRLMLISDGAITETVDVTDPMNAASIQTTLTASSDAGRDYLFVGNRNSGVIDKDRCTDQREHLFTVRRGELFDLAATVRDYWGWYYPECPSGFRGISPLGGIVHNGRLYRFLYQAADVHRIFMERIEPPAEIFADGFESGGTDKWTEEREGGT